MTRHRGRHSDMTDRGGRRRIARRATVVVVGAAALLAAPVSALALPASAGAAAHSIAPVQDCPTYASTFGSNVVSVMFHYQKSPRPGSCPPPPWPVRSASTPAGHRVDRAAPNRAGPVAMST